MRKSFYYKWNWPCREFLLTSYSVVVSRFSYHWQFFE